MLFDELVSVLENNPDSSLHVMLPSGDIVPEHFHVTEVGTVQKDFIDCGGTFRQSTSCNLQIWTANDLEHRLASKKLLKILKLANKTLDLSNLSVEIEYGIETVSQYKVNSLEVEDYGLLFVLSAKKTDCLAPDKCGISQCNTSGCC